MIIVHGLKEYVKFNKANWENIKSDLQKVLEKLTGLITFIESNVPHKMITYEHRLPWVTPILRKLINKKNKGNPKNSFRVDPA